MDITDKQVMALTLRSNIDVTDIVSFDSLDVIKFDQYLKYELDKLSSDRAQMLKFTDTIRIRN